MAKTALIIGATGLTGGQLLQVLLQSNYYSTVTVLVRQALSLKHEKLNQVVVNFDQLQNYAASIKADDVYCSIGTTIARAGSQQAFKKVDYEYPLKTAEIALWNGAKKFILVSSLGANAGSGIFYSRTKGELEQAIKNLKYHSLVVLRPSILLGHRKEQRNGEAVAQWAAKKLPFLFLGPFKQYRGTPVDLLARVMFKLAQAKTPAFKIVENSEIFEIAEKG